MYIPRKTIILLIIILILAAGNVYLGLNYFLINKEVQEARESLKKQQLNTKVINFSRLFIEKVLISTPQFRTKFRH